MNITKKSWRHILLTFILLLAVIALFQWYSRMNYNRIEAQNLNYAMDSARLTADRIEGEFANALQRIQNHVYFLGKSLDEPDIDQALLLEMEGNSAFDALRFVNGEGIKLVSDGSVSDSSDQEYYIKGIKGETGIVVVFESRVTSETMMGFYAPVRYQGKTFGVLMGVYFAEEYLREMLATTYFGEPADVFLCTGDGMVVASSSTASYDRPLLDMMLEDGVIDGDTAAGAWTVFHREADEEGFICGSDCQTDNLCVLHIPGTEYVLVQTFPISVTQAMIDDANFSAIALQIVLIGLFICYIIFLLVQARRERMRLEQENLDLGYVTKGTNTLFSRFVLVDLEEDSYRFLCGTVPEREGFPISGRYQDFAAYLCAFVTEDDERESLAGQLEEQAVIAALDDSKNAQYEYPIQREDSVDWLHLNVVCLERKDGKASKVVFLRQDVTALKEKELQAQARIARANRRERQYMAATMQGAVCTYEINLTRDLIEQPLINNEKVLLLEEVGLRAPCQASRFFTKWEQFVDRESLEDYRAVINIPYLRDCFDQGKYEATVEYWSGDPAGRRLCVRQSFFMTWDDVTEDAIALVIVKDITEQVLRQREQMDALQEALLQAQHANNAKTTFLNNMSHDIRTPMNAIIGFTTIAVTHIDNRNQVQDCLQKVLSSSNHLLSLINDILDMSRIESGKVQIKEQACNISELTHSLMDIIQPQVKAKQMDLYIDTFNVANEDVIADPLKLNQVFINLLSNAVKYTPSGGMVTFRIIQDTTFHRGYGDYTFIVKDNGAGMSPEFVEHIFEPFEREDTVTKTGIQGSGLGMAITKSIVEMMGGEISVTSEKGKGSEFRVKLSLKLQDVEKNAEQIHELEGLRVLVVDDDFSTCDSVTRMLKQLGMRTEWTTSSREAVYRAQAAHSEGDSYHTYIIDWQMPEMNGVETARRIRHAVGSEAPIIVLTAYDWTDIEQEAKDAGISAFCAKPLFMSDLKSVLMATNDLACTEEEDAPRTPVDFGGKRILLVEDNELNREIAETILEEAGFVVDSAPDGTDAVDMMKASAEHYYDAILMDIQMPVMDGYEATRTIRTLPRQDAADIPIIAMTANAMEEDKETALTSGMNAHIAKPLDMELFLSILQKFLG